jgi:hypothetical protein
MPANQRSTSRSIRILRRILRQPMLLPAAAGFLGGIIVAILVVRVGSIAILILAATSGLGATIAWWIRGAQDRRIQRAMRERLQRRIQRARRLRRNQGTIAEVEPATAGAAKPEKLLACHDFNEAKGHFDHW